MKKVLIIRGSAIGDIVECLPVASAIKNNFDEEFEIHWMVRRKFKKILEGNRFIDKILYYEDYKDLWFRIVKRIYRRKKNLDGLNTNYEKVTVVDHSQIMPAECIPCFNSNVIEYFLPFIPNLSEKFLYGNDDTFFGDYVKPEDFFEGDRPIARMMYNSKFNDFKKRMRNFFGNKYKKNVTPMGNAIFLLQQEYGDFEVLSTHHNIDAYSKSAYLETLKKFSDKFTETNKYRFRNKNCIHRLIFTLDAILSNKAVYEIVPAFSGVCKVLVSLKREPVFSYFGKEYHIDRLKKVIKQNKPKLFCLNASEKATPKIKIEAKKFMEEMFPEPSKFEKV